MVTIKNLLLGSLPLLATSLAAPADVKGMKGVNKRGLKPPKLDFKIYHGKNPQDALARRDEKVDIPIQKGPGFYLADISLGSSKQELFVLVDTGSSDLWVLDDEANCIAKRHSPFGEGRVYEDGSLVYSTFFTDLPFTGYTTLVTTKVVTSTDLTTKTVTYTTGGPKSSGSIGPNDTTGKLEGGETATPGPPVGFSNGSPVVPDESTGKLEGGETATPGPPVGFSNGSPVVPDESTGRLEGGETATPGAPVGFSSGSPIVSSGSTSYLEYSFDGTIVTLSPGATIPTTPSDTASPDGKPTMAPNYPLFSIDGGFITLTPGAVIPTPKEGAGSESPKSPGGSSKSDIGPMPSAGAPVGFSDGSIVTPTATSSPLVLPFGSELMTVTPGATVPSTSETASSTSGIEILPNYPWLSWDGKPFTLSPGAVMPTPKDYSVKATVTSALTLLAKPSTKSTPSHTVLQDDCRAYGTFNSDDSDTFKLSTVENNFEIHYVDNSSALGVWGVDDITISGTTVKDLQFGIVNKTSSTLGIFGIGLPVTEVALKKYDNYPVLLKKQGYINKVAYSLYLNSDNAQQGSVLFGAVDHAKYTGPLTTVKMTEDSNGLPSKLEIPLDTWVLSLDKKDVKLTGQNYSALLDSGATITSVPVELFKTITQQLSANLSAGAYVVDCSVTLKEFVFSFGQTHIKSSLLNFVSQSDNSCTLNIQAQGGDLITLGDNFLRSAYVVYDLEDYEISIAQVKYTDEEDVEIIDGSIPGATASDSSDSPYASAPLAVGPTSSTTSLTNNPIAKRSSSASALRLSTMSIFMGLLVSLAPFIRVLV